MERVEAIEKVRRLISGEQEAMLTTLDESGRISTRPMVMHDIDDDGYIWFFTQRDGRKAFELNGECQATVAIRSKRRRLSLTGCAQLLDDATKEHELWTPMMRAFFPDGVDAPDLTLVKFHVEEVEVWESADSPVSQVIGFVRAAVTGHADSGGVREQFVMPH